MVAIVALLVSAWIEIPPGPTTFNPLAVALLVSAWIEIQSNHRQHRKPGSRTPRECVD